MKAKFYYKHTFEAGQILTAATRSYTVFYNNRCHTPQQGYKTPAEFERTRH